MRRIVGPGEPLPLMIEHGEEQVIGNLALGDVGHCNRKVVLQSQCNEIPNRVEGGDAKSHES